MPGMSNAQVQATIRGMSRMLKVNDDAKVAKDDLHLTTDEM